MNLNGPAVRNKARWLFILIAMMSLSVVSQAQVAVGISVRVGPPALPVYAQPICPGPGYLWTPGYWGWNDDAGYYWVPGTWVVAPVGLLWTPGYWGWGGGVYLWHAGYWGPHIGFYGGINYGFGYGGVGFVGGEWRGGAFYYNRSVTNVSVTNVTNVYNKTVIVNENHTAFNGGEGGVQAHATAAEQAAAREHHTAPLASQTEHEHMASQNRSNFASENHGKPSIAATAKPGDFSGRSAVSARSAGGQYHAPAMSPKEARGSSTSAGSAHASSTGAGKGNEGFRPFNPPSKGNSASSPRAESTQHSAPSHSASSAPSHSAPAPRSESRPSPSSHQSQRNSSPSSHQSPRNSSPPPKPSKPAREDHHRGR